MSHNEAVFLERDVISVSGPDRAVFLQGLITNDIEAVTTDNAVYACLLTPQGKYLFDFLIIEEGETYLFEMEKGQGKNTINHFKKYKLRSDINIEILENRTVLAGLSDRLNTTIAYADPRHQDLGFRAIICTEEAENFAPIDFTRYDMQRIKLGVPDGTRDMKPEFSTLMECNIDALNGISWDKGCYMGQELTARMKYRNLGKKRLMTVTSEKPLPEADTDILNAAGKRVGEMRSSCTYEGENLGLALLKTDAADDIAGMEIYQK